ncbi:MAG TPA: RHS repeat-associated core domain-containing protein [Terriglobia bacterium]|nr:RHS repeat-associated core domain-containing protein [Terriglobia bacterium]
MHQTKATAVAPGTVNYDMQYQYDFFGNMSCDGSSGIGCPGLSFDSNNHITGANITYDAAGNMTQDGTGTGTHTYTYDAENRLTQVDGGSTQTFLYNALGQRVEWTAGSTTYDELFDVDGNRIVQAVGGVWNTGNFFLGSRMLGAYIPGTGTVQFFHANALGLSSVITDGTGAVVNEQLFYPWGDLWETTGQTWFHFAGFDWGYTQAGLDPTLFRMYSYGKGRWMTPDPAGLAAVDITNPESWNRYAYALNRPTSLTDRSGLLDDPACDNLDPDMDGDSFGSDPEEGFEGGQMCIQIAPIIPPLPIPPVPKTPPHQPPPPPPKMTMAQRMACAAQFGDNHSLAAPFQSGNATANFLTNAFLGNVFSGAEVLGQTIFGNETPTGSQVATTLVGGAGLGIVPVGGPGMQGPAGMAQDAAAGAFFNSVTGAGSAPITGITGAAAQSAPVAADALSVTGATVNLGAEAAGTGAETFAFGVAAAKVGFDLSTFLYGFVVACTP